MTIQRQTPAGWQKWAHNPVLGGDLGTCFDLTMLQEQDTYRMWFSWRPQRSIALSESQDGIHWNTPEIVLAPEAWEMEVNRPSVVKVENRYHLWYTGQTWEGERTGTSAICYATSSDGRNWVRVQSEPVLSAALPWEGVAAMCPHVLWDEAAQLFRMWYSGGEQYEPDAIGYASSRDGIHWQKYAANPMFAAHPEYAWEKAKVTACQVVPWQTGYLMFYIGFADIDHAQIGLARSPDGITRWERHPANPLISPGKEDEWDADAVYKPYAIWNGERWLLWYNGRRANVEQIGLAIHEGKDLAF
jgi:beta-1,2-mannobiose phosphorylase / 1,2-beta-oligomannan phosphorylase